MNLIREHLLELMRSYFGLSSQFLLDKTLQRLNISDINHLDEDNRGLLEETLVDDVFSTVASLQKIKMIRSQLDVILNEREEE